METSDQILLQQWYRHSDAEAFHQITQRYAGLVYGTCRRILHNTTDAEDVAQECFETLAVKTRVDGTALGAWLHKAATRRALDRIKMDTRRRGREQRAAAAQPESVSPTWDDIYALVDEAIVGLPEKERLPLTAHFLEGQTHEEIAARMGISRPTVSYRIQQGLGKIRSSFKHRNITMTTAALGAALGANLSAQAAPVTLIATLGKLALSSTPATSVLSTTIARTMLLKKALLIVAMVVAIVGGVGLAIHRQMIEPPRRDASVEDSEREAVAAVDSTVIPPTANEQKIFGALLSGGDQPRKGDAGLGDLTVVGRVVYKHGAPVGDAAVQVDCPAGTMQTRTQKDGTFRLTGLAPGEYTAGVWREEIRPNMWATFKFEAGDQKVVFTLSKSVLVSGHVVDARTGFAIPRFMIATQRGLTNTFRDQQPTSNHQAVDNPQGQFKMASTITKGATFVVQADGYAATFTPIRLEDVDPVHNITVALNPGCIAEGRVTDATGKPAAGTWILAQSPRNLEELRQYANLTAQDRRESLRGFIVGETDATGAFYLDTLGGDEAYLYAFHPDFGNGQAPLVWGGNTRCRNVDIVLGRPSGVAEILVTIAGSPAQGALVYAGGNGVTFESDETGPDGRVTLDQLPDGFIRISAQYPTKRQPGSTVLRGITVEKEVRDGASTSVTIDFAATTTVLEGQVRRGDEIPSMVGVTLDIATGDRTERHGLSSASTDGKFLFESISSGEIVLSIFAVFEDEKRWKYLPVALLEGERQYLDIDLSGGGTIRGIVTGTPAAGHGNVKALRGKQVIADPSRKLMRSLGNVQESFAPVRADGTYAIEGVSPGHYTLLCTVRNLDGSNAYEGARFATVEIDVVEGEITVADFDMSE